jgi:cell division protein FtsI/penicillin-binding protein 2
VLKKDKDKILSILKSQNIPVKTHNNSKYYDFVYHLFTKNDVEKLKKLLRKYAKDEKIGCFYYKNFYFAPFEEKRIYPQGKLFTPIEGITKVKTKNILIRVGVNGLEGADNSRENRVKSTLNYNFQQKITSLIDKRKNLDGSVKIVAVLINKNTGEILASVNTDRYDPNHITQKDIPYTKTDVNFYLFDRKPFIQKYYNLIDEKYKNENYEKIFELNKPSSDLPLERQEKGKFNFLQLIKFATPFTNGGYLVEPHYLKATPIVHKKIPFII